MRSYINLCVFSVIHIFHYIIAIVSCVYSLHRNYMKVLMILLDAIIVIDAVCYHVSLTFGVHKHSERNERPVTGEYVPPGQGVGTIVFTEQ